MSGEGATSGTPSGRDSKPRRPVWSKAAPARRTRLLLLSSRYRHRSGGTAAPAQRGKRAADLRHRERGSRSRQLLDSLLETVLADLEVASGGPNIGMAGELGDDLESDACLGQQGAEGVTERVRGLVAFGHPGPGGVARDDPSHRPTAERPGRVWLGGQAQQQPVAVDDRSGAIPRLQRLDRPGGQRDGAMPAALAWWMWT